MGHRSTMDGDWAPSRSCQSSGLSCWRRRAVGDWANTECRRWLDRAVNELLLEWRAAFKDAAPHPILAALPPSPPLSGWVLSRGRPPGFLNAMTYHDILSFLAHPSACKIIRHSVAKHKNMQCSCIGAYVRNYTRKSTRSFSSVYKSTSSKSFLI
jgi:hypothetical protein